METSLETLEDNKVKLTVDVTEAEFEADLDAAFKRIAEEVNLPGFRKGKAPRKVLEARLGQTYARGEALREGLPNYYSDAVNKEEVDVIAPPEIDVTAGEESGPITFEAVVEVRPQISISGYKDIELEVPALAVSAEDVQEAIDSVRGQGAETQEVQRAAVKGDTVVIDIETSHNDEPVAGFTTQAYSYKVGAANIVPEMDENLEGVSAGDEVEFDAAHPDETEEAPLKMKIKVVSVAEPVLPELNADWVKDNSEFETVDELTEDYRKRLEVAKVSQAQNEARNQLSDKLAELVADDLVPQALVDNQADTRLQDMAMRLQAQGLSFEQFMQFSGQSQEQIMEEVKSTAEVTARLDLALRAIAINESLEVSDEDIDDELRQIAAQIDKTVDELRQDFSKNGHMRGLKADLLKSKTLDWLMETVAIKDTEGQVVTSSDLEINEEESS